MTISEALHALKIFRKRPWKFQQTFLTPMQSLQSFVAAIVSANQQQAYRVAASFPKSGNDDVSTMLRSGG
jgi:hypothetical protein